jgi:hypothetical protein
MIDKAIQEVIDINMINAEQTNTDIRVINNLQNQRIYNDCNRFQQVLISFIGNSIKNTSTRNVTIILDDFDNFSFCI